MDNCLEKHSADRNAKMPVAVATTENEIRERERAPKTYIYIERERDTVSFILNIKVQGTCLKRTHLTNGN